MLPFAYENPDPAGSETIWSAGVGIERDFKVGRLNIAVFGEALLLGGHQPGRVRQESSEAREKFRVSGRFTTGVKMKF